MPSPGAWKEFTPEKKIVVVVGGMPFMYRDTRADFDTIKKFFQEQWGLEDPRLEMFLTDRDYYGMSDTPQARAEFIFSNFCISFEL